MGEEKRLALLGTLLALVTGGGVLALGPDRGRLVRSCRHPLGYGRPVLAVGPQRRLEALDLTLRPFHLRILEIIKILYVVLKAGFFYHFCKNSREK